MLIYIRNQIITSSKESTSVDGLLVRGSGNGVQMALGITRKQLIMVIVLVSGTFLATLNATLVTPALPAIMRDLSIEVTTVQWLVSGYSLAGAVAIPLSAYVMGRFSVRKIYLVGVAFFGAGSLTVALAPIFPLMLIGRFVQAICSGIVLTMVSSVVLLIFPREKRGSAMGVVGLVLGFAPAIGPSLAGMLIDTIGWRAIFGIVAAFAAIIVVAAAFSLENYGNFERIGFDGLSVVLSTLGLLGVLYGISTLGSSENAFIPVIMIVTGAALIAIYARRQLGLKEPMLDVGILKYKEYRVAALTVALLQAALIGTETILPLYIQNVLGKSATISGLTLLPGALSGALASMVAGRLFDKHGVRMPSLLSLALIVVAAFGYMALTSTSPVLFVVVTYFLMGMGAMGLMTPLNTWGVNALPNEAIRHSQAMSNILAQVAGAFGTALLVSVSSIVSSASAMPIGTERTFTGFHASFITLGVIVAVVFIIVVARVHNKKNASSAATQTGAASRSQERQLSATFENKASLRVRDVMNPHGATIKQGASMREVVEKMVSVETTGVSVVDDDGRLVGFITDGDVARYLARQDATKAGTNGSYYLFFVDDGDMGERLQDLADTTVDNLAAKRVMTVDEDMPLDEACALMTAWNFKKVPVEKDGILVGSLSRRNIIKYMFHEVVLEKNEDVASELM